MLSENERKRLDHRDDPQMVKHRRSNEYVVRQKLRRWLDDAEDVLFIMNRLPEKQILRIINNSDAARLFKISEELVELLGFYPVEGSENPETWHVTRQSAPGKFEVRAVTDDDIAQSILIHDHLNKLLIHMSRTDPVYNVHFFAKSTNSDPRTADYLTPEQSKAIDRILSIADKIRIEDHESEE